MCCDDGKRALEISYVPIRVIQLDPLNAEVAEELAGPH